MMPVILSDNKTFARQYNGIAYLRFWFKIWRGYRAAEKRLKKTLRDKICYYGPFKGEFGHMTAHTAPFLMYLHRQGVKIIYCGMEIHKPLLVDDNGQSIIHDFRPLRDFFAEVSPRTNNTVPPADVAEEIQEFVEEAEASGKAFWNIGDSFYYWFIHRNWLLRNHMFTYDLRKAYGTKEENSVCLFPRSKGSKVAKNNGAPWNYQEVIECIRPYFDKVYICGHPSQSESLSVSGNVELYVSTDNRIMLEKCANAKLIITQHSGVNNIGVYTNTKVLIIYNGGARIDDIGSIYNTLRFRPAIGESYPLSFAFTPAEISDFARRFKQNGYKTPDDWKNTAGTLEEATRMENGGGR